MQYYIIDDLRLPPKRSFRKGWTMEQFPSLREALARYRALPSRQAKSLGMTDGIHVLELARHVLIYPAETAWEDVQAACKFKHLTAPLCLIRPVCPDFFPVNDKGKQLQNRALLAGRSHPADDLCIGFCAAHAKALSQHLLQALIRPVKCSPHLHGFVIISQLCPQGRLQLLEGVVCVGTVFNHAASRLLLGDIAV